MHAHINGIDCMARTMKADPCEINIGESNACLPVDIYTSTTRYIAKSVASMVATPMHCILQQ